MTMLSLFDCDSSAESDDAEAVGSQSVPLAQLPPLPDRGSGYRSEPFMGVCIVTVLSAMLVSVVQAISAAGGEAARSEMTTIVVTLIWAEAGIAVLCTCYILFGGAGVIARSPATCYPIPDEVEQRLRESRSLEGMKNVPGPQGSPTMGTYCVRCLVWRPPKEAGKVHHCNVCQRCVRGFDHHCGVFGRCIVRDNMICFVSLIGMMFAGMLTAMVAVTANAGTSSSLRLL